MRKREKKITQKLAVKEEESSATNHKGHHMAPSESSCRFTRWSITQLAMGHQSSLKGPKSPATQEFPPTEKVTQEPPKKETCLASQSPVQDIPTIKKAAKDTQEPPKLLAYTRQKFIRPHVTIDSSMVAKKGKFVLENYNNEEEISKQSIQPCQTTQTNVKAQIAVALPLSLRADMSVIALTEMVNLDGKDSHEDSDEEITSSANHALYYGVKEENAPLIATIFAKYGDIAKNHSLKSSMACSFFLEMVCGVIQKLKRLTYKDIKIEDLDSMLHELDDVESNGIQVDWLQKKIKEIKEVKREAKTIMSNSKSIKETRDKVNIEIEEVEMGMQMDDMLLRVKQDLVQKYEQKIKDLQGNIRKAQDEMVPIRERKTLFMKKLDELKTEYEKIHTHALHKRKKVHSLYQPALVEGLL